MSTGNFPIPREKAPELSFQLTTGEKWNLSEQDPESFTMIVFYRGLHCPVCKGYTKTLQNLKDKYAERGINIVTVSMDTEERAQKSAQKWGIENLDVGFGLTEEQARNWGLYLSNRIKEEEPELFSEPGLFLVRRDGELYYAAVNSMPFGRPDPEALLQAVDFIQKNDYPARGEVKEAAGITGQK